MSSTRIPGPDRPLRLVRGDAPDAEPPTGASDALAPARPSHASPGLAPGEDAEPIHPLTSRGLPLLPARHVAGQADVWEAVDRAAAWVVDRSPAADAAGREVVRHALRVLCVAVRAAVVDGAPMRAQDLPWQAPVVELLGALRRRLVSQALTPDEGDEWPAHPEEVLQVVGALDRLEASARADVARSTVDELSGPHALELLVEVAHDMRSPLGSILFLVERLRGQPAVANDPSSSRALGLVYGAAFGLSSMVGDVMELARGGDRLAGGEPAPFALAALVAELRDIVQPIAEEKRLEFTVGPVPPEVRVGHASALQRVLLNLVTNALKFTPAGEVALRVTADGPTRVSFTIQDTGPGIPAAVQAQLFQAFRPRSTGQGTAFSSAGLGLAICRKLVATMGGELRVASLEGRGTRFAFALELPPAPILAGL